MLKSFEKFFSSGKEITLDYGHHSAPAVATTATKTKAYALGGLREGSRAKKVLNTDMNKVKFSEPKGFRISKPMESHLAFAASQNDTMDLAKMMSANKKSAFEKSISKK